MSRLLIGALIFFSVSYFSYAENNIIYADKVLVKKADHKMFLLKDGKPYREYNIALGDAPKGHKQQQGDERTPEGIYTIDYRNPKSAYHLSLHINYPNKKDKESAKRKGVSPGGDIFIHGSPNRFAFLGAVFSKLDWTDGCIAVTNKEIKEIWTLVKNGTPIEILP